MGVGLPYTWNIIACTYLSNMGLKIISNIKPLQILSNLFSYGKGLIIIFGWEPEER